MAAQCDCCASDTNRVTPAGRRAEADSKSSPDLGSREAEAGGRRQLTKNTLIITIIHELHCQQPQPFIEALNTLLLLLLLLLQSLQSGQKTTEGPSCCPASAQFTHFHKNGLLGKKKRPPQNQLFVMSQRASIFLPLFFSFFVLS